MHGWLLCGAVISDRMTLYDLVKGWSASVSAGFQLKCAWATTTIDVDQPLIVDRLVVSASYRDSISVAAAHPASEHLFVPRLCMPLYDDSSRDAAHMGRRAREVWTLFLCSKLRAYQQPRALP